MKLHQLFKFLSKSSIQAGEGMPIGKYPFFTSSDTKIQYLDDYIYDCEAVILGTGGMPSCNYYHGKFSTSTDTIVLQSIGDVSAKYLYYFLRKDNLDILLKGFHGAGLKHIGKDYIKNINIQILEPKIQNQIISELDLILKLIDSNERQINRYDELIKSRFYELFGDPELNTKNYKTVPIGNTCFVTKLAGYEYSKHITYKNHGDVVMVKAQNVKNGKITEKDFTYITNEESDLLPRSQLAENDLVMTYVGANLGDVAIIDKKHRYHLAPNVAKIRPDSNKYNSIFLMVLLMLLKKYIVKSSTDTAKGVINMNNIRNLTLILPDIKTQNEYAEFYSIIDKSKQEVQSRKVLYSELFNKKLNEYFKMGEI